MSPVTWQERGRKQASCRPAGSTRGAMSGALRRNQTRSRVPMRQPPGVHRQAHGPVERAHQHRQPAPRGPGDQQLVRLVGAHQQRRAELLQQGDEAVGLGVAELDGLGRCRRGVGTRVLVCGDRGLAVHVVTDLRRVCRPAGRRIEPGGPRGGR